MALPDYSKLGFNEILVRLDGPVGIVTINRAKQFVFQELKEI
jgi:hypothetical protein